MDLSAFNTVENANDVEAIRQSLGFGRITFYGTSYGTELGQYLMRQHPDNLRAVVLDAVVPLQFNVSFGEWEKISRLQAKPSGLMIRSLPQLKLGL